MIKIRFYLTALKKQYSSYEIASCVDMIYTLLIFLFMYWMIFTLFLSRLNKIFDIGYFSDSRIEGYVLQLHKRGNINDANIYRGIALLSCIGTIILNSVTTDCVNGLNCITQL